MFTDYFLDSENLNGEALQYVEELDKSDKLYIFYSCQSARVPIELMKYILQAQCKIQFIECDNGTPNAMDFKIVSYLGLKVGGYKHKYNKHTYVILSKDTGYDSAIEFYKQQGVTVLRKDSLFTKEEIKNNQKSNITTKKDSILETLKTSPIYDSIIKDCIKRSGSLSNFHVLLQKSTDPFIRKNCTVVYHEYKNTYNKIKEGIV